MKVFMKRFFAVALLLVAFGSLSFAQNGNGNGNNNQLIGRAIGAFNGGCAGPSIGPLDGSVETVGICFAGGFITRVLLYRHVNCQQVDCLAIRFAPIGYVDFDCDNNVINVSCLWP